jgi:hypothetical protein
VTINITPVNDAPSFVKGADQTVPEDAGAKTIANWATSASAGPASEVGADAQLYSATNTNNGLFSARKPLLPPTAPLTFTHCGGGAIGLGHGQRHPPPIAAARPMAASTPFCKPS